MNRSTEWVTDLDVGDLDLDLDVRDTADALAAVAAAAVEVEVRQVLLVAHFADLHNAETLKGRQAAAGGRVLPGTERAVHLGGAGTPKVTEFAAAELGILLKMTTHGAQALLRDVLDLRHRHPLLWRAVVSGQARFWQARQVTRATSAAGLSLELAQQVDARTAPHLGAVSWGRMMNLVDAAIIAADPVSAEERRLAAELERFVRIGQSNEYGLSTIYARCKAGEARFVLAMCDRLAQILALNGDPDPLDVRRSKALAILATPAQALALLQQAEMQPAAGTHDPDPDERNANDDAGVHDGSATPEDGEQISEGDLHPSQNDADETAAPPAKTVVIVNPSVHPDRYGPHATLYVHLTLDQYLRHCEGAARLDGVGPVTVEGAREFLRHCNVTITPVVDTNQTSAVDAYEAPHKLREVIHLKNPVEIFPWGTLPSRKADLDHVDPYREHGPPGQTSTDNLAPLSRSHHRVKTHGHGWIHRQPVPGVHYWRTPSGRWARVDHHGTTYLGTNLPREDRDLLSQAVQRTEPPNQLEQHLADLTSAS